jgi:hypothetical protein
MALDPTFKNFSDAFTQFWLGSIRRWRKVSVKIENDTFDADALAASVGEWWNAAAKLAFSIFPETSALPVLPLEAAAGAAVNASGSAYLENLTLTQALSSTDLVWLGDTSSLQSTETATIPGASIAVQYDDMTLGKLQATVKYQAQKNLVAGTYQGIIYSKSIPAAMILLKLT